MKEKIHSSVIYICDASFSENTYLNRHIEAVHDKNKPFKIKFMHCGIFILEMSVYFWDFPSWHTAQMAAIIMKPSWSPNLSNGAFITTMKNQTCFGKTFSFLLNRRFSNPIILLEKPSVLVQNRRKYKLSNYIKTEGFSRKTFCFFSKKLKEN